MSQITTQHGTALPRRRGNSRATVRYHCAPATVGRLYVGNDHEFQHAWILNLSQHGIGFFLARSLAAGLLVHVQIRGDAPGVVHELSATVVHCTVQITGEWLVGCEFTQPLSADVLDSLL